MGSALSAMEVQSTQSWRNVREVIICTLKVLQNTREGDYMYSRGFTWENGEVGFYS